MREDHISTRAWPSDTTVRMDTGPPVSLTNFRSLPLPFTIASKEGGTYVGTSECLDTAVIFSPARRRSCTPPC